MIYCSLRGNCTSYPKLAFFVLYPKINNTFVKITYASYSKLFEAKRFVKLGIKTVLMLFGSITQETLSFDTIFEFIELFTIRSMNYFPNRW